MKEEARKDDGFVPDEATARELATALREAEAGDFVSEADFWKQVAASQRVQPRRR